MQRIAGAADRSTGELAAESELSKTAGELMVIGGSWPFSFVLSQQIVGLNPIPASPVIKLVRISRTIRGTSLTAYSYGP